MIMIILIHSNNHNHQNSTHIITITIVLARKVHYFLARVSDSFCGTPAGGAALAYRQPRGEGRR